MFAKIQYDSQKRDSQHSCFYVSPVVTFTVTQAQQNVAEGFLESITFATGSESDCFQTVSVLGD